ncbi:hypothetical protein [Streptomyces rimosus]|uniref:hypothetical protein n=1 Tax=Streptomyces rimosus TaxID=1927 RepID=UPI0031200EF4
MNDYVHSADLRIAYDISGPPYGPPLEAVHGSPYYIHCWDGVLPHRHRAGCRFHPPYLRAVRATRCSCSYRPKTEQSRALGRDRGDDVDALELHDVIVSAHDWRARAGYVVNALFTDGISPLVPIAAG